MRNLPPGAKLGRFRILSVLGEGAMGVVYLAEDPEIERRVAIKTLRALSEASPAARADLEVRFLKEAKLAGRLQHPNIVTVFEVGREGETAFMAMEYVEGESLTRVATPALDIAARLDVVRQVAQALQHAHDRGVLHRDVKPGNILVTRDRRVKVADFGIGKLLSGGTADLTRSGQMLGSPAYMSPEQIRGEKLDGRSDLFSLGVVAYELLTGARPFPGDSITTLVYQILHTEPRDPLEVRADLPPATREVFARLLAKAPARRPGDAAEFLAELRKIESELSAVEPTQAIPIAARVATGAAGRRANPPVAAAPEDPRAAAGRTTVPSPRAPRPGRGGGPAYLFGAAALLSAVALLLWMWRGAQRREERVAAASPSPAALETSRPAPPGAGAGAASAGPAALQPTPAPPPEPSAAALPTPGPPSAADAVVGATRLERTAPARARAVPTAPPPPPPAEATPAAAVASAAAPASDRASHASVEPADNVYRTRRFVKFSSSPEQARVYLDGRYVGIVDDWDSHGGGRTLPLAGEGRHRVRLELPGYRTLQLDFLVSPDAGDDTIDVDEELKRQSRVEYPKLKSPFDRTEGPVVFEVTPGSAVVSEGGRPLGPVSAFGPATPLKLSGPTVHDLTVAAPGYEPRLIRILVSSNADREKASVRFALKPD